MHTKKDFFRLLGAKESMDDYLFWMFRHWYKTEYGVSAGKGPFYRIVEVIEYPRDTGFIKLRFDNDENCEYSIPISYMYDADKTPIATMLWYSDYYDGPLSGLAEYDGKKVWFSCIEWEDENLFNTRIFALYELSKEEVEYEEKWHQFFRDNVGHHCDYVEGKKGEVNYTQESFDRFYEAAKKEKKRDYTKNKLITKLDETFFQRGYPRKKVDNEDET